MRVFHQVAKGLGHRPAYTGTIVAVTAISCALLTTVFAVVDGVLFKPLGYPDESRLVAIKVFSNHRQGVARVLPDDLAAWTQSLPGVAFTGFLAQPVEATSSVARAVVQSNFFDVIGIKPAVGGFATEDFEPVASTVEPRLVTAAVFRSQFGGDLNAIGRVVIRDPSTGYGYRIVGVMPREFTFPAYQFSVGYVTTYRHGSDVGFQHVIARLSPDVGVSELRQRLFAVIMARNHTQSSGISTPPIDEIAVEPLGRALRSSSRSLFGVLVISAALLVCVAAINVSGLMAARSIDRARELEVRRALGATSTDIGRLILTEALLLVTGGAILGLTIAIPLLRLTTTLLPFELALFKIPAIDWRVVAFTAVVAIVLSTLTAVWPLRAASARGAALRPTRHVTLQSRHWSQRAVVVVQVALALMLTIGGALFVASLLSVYLQRPSITTDRTLTILVRFSGAGGNSLVPERVTRTRVLIERLRSVPGVDGAAVTAYELLDRAYVRSWFRAPASALNPGLPTMTQAVTADFYRVVEPRLIEGRLPGVSELATDEPLIVVSQSVARNFWPNASAIGQTLTDQGPRPDPARTFTVVGVIDDIRWYGWDEPALPTIYGPYALLARQAPAVVLIRRLSASASVQADVLRAMAEVDPQLRIRRVMSLRELFVDSVRPRRFLAWLFGSFAAVTLCVVGVGIFGQLAMSTARRTREIGIRMTCGATRAAVIRLIVAEQLPLVFAGLLVGGISAAWSVQFVRTRLYEVTAFDARAWVGTIGLILVTAIAGIAVPALRASRADPVQALRAD